MKEKPLSTSIFLFRRDLRLNDNIGLLAALKKSKIVIPYAAIAKICKKYECTFSQHNDLLLTQPEDVKTKKNSPFSIFTPFLKAASKIAVHAKKYSSIYPILRILF